MKITKEHGLIALAAVLYGTIIPGGRLFVGFGFSLFEIALFSMALLTICIIPILLLKPGHLIPVRLLPFFIVYGLIGACVSLAQFTGLFFGVPVAVVAFLLYTQPLWTVFLGRVVLGELITARKLIATLLSLAGTGALMLSEWTGRGGTSIVGLSAALCGGLFLSIWVILGRKSGLSQLHFVTTTFGLSSFTVLWLIVLWFPISLLVTDPSIVRLSLNFPSAYWPYLTIFAVVSGLIPSFCFFRGMRLVEATEAGVLLLLEPVAAGLLAWGLFAQRLGLATFFGACLILVSNYLIIGKGETSRLK